MTTAAYRQTIRAELKKRYPDLLLGKPLPHRLLWLLPLLGMITLCVTLIVSTGLPAVIRLVASLLLGVTYASCGFYGHDILHGSVIRSKRLQNLIGGLCMLPWSVPPTLWRWQHNRMHHGNTQVPGEDVDGMPLSGEFQERWTVRLVNYLAVGRPLVFLPLLGLWFQLHNSMLFIRTLADTKQPRSQIAWQYLVGLIFWVWLLKQVGLNQWLLIYALPAYISGFIVMSFIGTNHLLNELAGDDKDPVRTSLSLTMWWFFRVIFFNFNFHTAHHVYAGVSSTYYGQITDIIRQRWPEHFHELSWGKAVWLLGLTPKIYFDDTHLIHPVRGVMSPVLGHGLEQGYQPTTASSH